MFDVLIVPFSPCHRIKWAYNWAPTHTGSLNSGVEYVPMLWGTDANHASGWADHANAAIAAGSTHLLG